MPTKPRNPRERTFESTEKKWLATKNDYTIAALIRGIRDPDRARKFIEAELELADEDGREPRRDLIGMCNAKAAAIRDRPTAE